ncbi:MAG: hypothetical protein J1F16_04050 [Muribaculaceae bacterium]|nr:hypothetical protein [Muribaculaceae bacterium]
MTIGAICSLSSCNEKEEVMRVPDDILGIWTPDNVTYLEYSDNNEVYRLQVDYDDGETIGLWWKETYYYEPGYNLVLYVDVDDRVNVYQVVEMTQNTMTWCWVEEVNYKDAEDMGHVIGSIINKAQEGYVLNPEYYQSFTRLSRNEFFRILENLGIDYPLDD